MGSKDKIQLSFIQTSSLLLDIYIMYLTMHWIKSKYIFLFKHYKYVLYNLTLLIYNPYFQSDDVDL